MKRTPDIERMHSINLHICRTKIAETLLEFEGKFNHVIHCFQWNCIELLYIVSINYC